MSRRNTKPRVCRFCNSPLCTTCGNCLGNGACSRAYEVKYEALREELAGLRADRETLLATIHESNARMVALIEQLQATISRQPGEAGEDHDAEPG